VNLRSFCYFSFILSGFTTELQQLPLVQIFDRINLFLHRPGCEPQVFLSFSFFQLALLLSQTSFPGSSFLVE
jgi:hypothetical protein